MPLLLSEYFRNTPRFQACCEREDAPIREGEIGPHVVIIQYAALLLNGGAIDGVELSNGYFGPTTAQAVLGYNATRRISALRSDLAPVDYVTRQTILDMDREMVRLS